MLEAIGGVVSSGAAEQMVQAEGREPDGNGLAAEQELQEQDAELVAVKVGFVGFLGVSVEHDAFRAIARQQVTKEN